MSEFKVNTITNRDGSYGPQVCGITTFGSSGMQLPSGPTEFRGGRGRAVFAGGSQQPSGSQWQKVMDKLRLQQRVMQLILVIWIREDIIIVQYQVLFVE